MSDGSERDNAPETGAVAEGSESPLPVARRLRAPGSRGFHQPRVLPWVAVGVTALLAMMLVGSFVPDISETISAASTLAALFFLLFAFGLMANLGRRAGVVATVLTALLAWAPFVEVRWVLVLGVVVAFVLFGLAGFNFLFIVEEILFDIHRRLRIRGTFWNAVPTVVLVGVTPLVYWLLPLVGLKWPTLSIGMPLVIILLSIAWGVRWKVGDHALKIVHEAHFLSIGIIVGAGLADLVTMLHQVESIVPTILVYLSIIVTWIFVSYTTLQRAQYFLRGTDVLPWLSLLFASAFAILAHVHFLYGIAGTPGLVAVNDVRINYLEYGVWLGLAFFVIRGGWRFFRFIRDETGLTPGARRTAGRVARAFEAIMYSSERVEEGGVRMFSALDRAIPGGRRHDDDEPYEDGEESDRSRR